MNLEFTFETLKKLSPSTHPPHLHLQLQGTGRNAPIRSSSESCEQSKAWAGWGWVRLLGPQAD